MGWQVGVAFWPRGKWGRKEEGDFFGGGKILGSGEFEDRSRGRIGWATPTRRCGWGCIGSEMGGLEEMDGNVVCAVAHMKEKGMWRTFEDCERAEIGRSQGRVNRRGKDKNKVGLKKVQWNVSGRRRRGRRKGELARKGVVELEEKLGIIVVDF
jgi:hypothetical protein